MSIESGVRETVKQVMEIDNENVEEVNLSDNLASDLDFDSVKILILVASLEEQFNMAFEETDFVTINTVSDIVKYIKENKHEE